MDSRLVCLCQLILLFVASSGFWTVQANHQFPTSRYSFSLNAKQIKEDLKQRRQHARRSRPISLKPPPEDWPEPPMAAADSLITQDEQRITSLSPLLAYQARLEQELLEQQKEDNSLNEPQIKNPVECSEEISLDDDFKKLLDPEELLRHNKQLKPFVSVGGQKPLEIVRSAGEQGKRNTRPGGISSLTALKAKSAKRKTRPAVDVVEGVVGRVAPRRGRKPKHSILQKETLEAQTQSSETKLREVEMKETLTEGPLKRRRKKKRTFAFANQPYFEDDVERVVPYNSRHEGGQTTTTPISTSATTKMQTKTTKTTATTIKINIRDIQGTTSKYHVEPETRTKQVPNADRATLTLADNKRLEICEKRKQVKKEMEKVLDVEQLEGSFSDKESDWKTSEEEFYVEYYEMNKAVKQKIEALKKFRTTIKPDNETTIKNVYKNIIQLIN